MLSSGFASAPVTRMLIVYVVAASILASATDTKHYFYIHISPHFWRYRQFWRLFTWQACFTNSTEVLFASVTLYHMRVIERLWGSRKFVSFLVATSIYTALLPPLLLALFLRPLSANTLNYLPAGPTPIIFALLAQYHAAVPYIYRYRIATSANTSSESNGILLTSKSLSYLLPIQLALAQLPGSLISAAIGWVIGYAWRAELLPFLSSRWRVPAWLYGGVAKTATAGRDRAEGLRRQMAGEVASATGMEQNSSSNRETRRRP